MKKNLLFPLTFLFILLFGLASCSDNNNLKTQADVTIDFPIQELFNIAAAREGGDSTVDVSLLITVTLYVNGSQYGTPQQQEFTSQMRQSGGSFEFKDITIGSRVKATAQVDSVSIVNGQKSVYPMLKGESQELKLSKSTLELPIELEYCDTKYTDVDNLCLQFYIQKTDSSGTPLANEYELYNSVYSRTELSFEQITQTLDFNSFYTQMAQLSAQLIAQGYELKKDEGGLSPVVNVSVDDKGIIYVAYYWDKAQAPKEEVVNVVYEIYASILQGSGDEYTEPELISSYSGYTPYDYEQLYAEYLLEESGQVDPEQTDKPEVPWETGLDPKVYYEGMYFNLALAVDFMIPTLESNIDMQLKGYYCEDTEYIITKKDGITYIKEIMKCFRVSEQHESLYTQVGSKAYALSLYPNNLVVLCDANTREKLMVGSLNGTLDENNNLESVYFQEYFYYENGKAQPSPLIWKDSKVFVMGSSAEYIDEIDITSKNLTITYRTQNPADDMELSFVLPEGFNILDWIDLGGWEEDYYSGVFQPVLSGISFINIAYESHERVYRNFGNLSFRAEYPSQKNIEINMSAELFYSGSLVSSELYETKQEGNILTITPINLPAGGIYIARIKATWAGQSVVNNFAFDVDGSYCTLLDISSASLLSDVVNTLAMADSNSTVSLHFYGQKNLQPDTNLMNVNLAQIIAPALLQYPAIPVELDFSEASGNIVYFLSLSELLDTSCKSIIISPETYGLSYVRYLYPALDGNDVQSDDDWYKISVRTNSSTTGDAMAIIAEFMNRPDVFNFETVVQQFEELNYTPADISLTDWAYVVGAFAGDWHDISDSSDYFFFREQ